MPADWRVEPLKRDHDRTGFGCGEPALDEYLARFARQNQESGVTRTFVAVRDAEPTRVLGYYSLAVGAIDRANLPPSAARRFPNFPLPIVRLARLAVDRSQQGKGLGEDLLLDALARSLRVAEEVGIVAVVIDAKHERAKAFYARYEFDALPDHPLTLWLPLPALSKLFESARHRREKEIDAQYERAYAGVEDPLGKDFEGWAEETPPE
jgi:GNAT superfamily N-acetyltransferase